MATGRCGAVWFVVWGAVDIETKGDNLMIGLLTALVGPVTDIISKTVTDKDEAAKMAHQIATLADQQAHQQVMAQLKVNEAEAASGSLFKGGWRPCCGWVCSLALAYTYIVQPFLTFALLAFGVDLPPLPTLATYELLPILLGMLGLGSMRTFERFQGKIPKGK